VPKQFFRVDGADKQTGEETYLVLQAPTKPLAEKLARQQGLLISSVRIARPDDWGGPPPEPEEEQQPDIETTQYIEPGMYALPAPPPAEAEVTHAPEADPQYDPPPEHEQFVDPAPATAVHPAYVAPAQDAAAATQPVSGGASAATVVLACVGGALVLGGVLALALALWPDNSLRNEIQQIDFRLHELSQTILGSMLVLAGLITFAVAVICYLVPRGR